MTGTVAVSIVDWAKRSSFLRLLLVITLAAELITLALNAVHICTWWGEHPAKLLIVGVVDALLVSIIALPVIILIILRLKEAEAEAAGKSTYLDGILRSSTETAIAATDTQFRLTLCNPAAEEMFGRKAEDVLGRDIRQVCGGEIAGRIVEAMEACSAGQECVRPLEVGEGDGKRHIESRVSGITDGQGALAGYVMVSRDVTERDKSENALRESEAKFRTLVEHSLFGVAIIQDGRYVYVNQRHAGMLGLTQQEMVSLEDVLAAVHPDDKELVAENIRKRATGEVRDIRYRFRFIKKDGETVHVEVHGSTAEFCGRPAVISSVLDITERVKAEAEIRELNEDLERRVEQRTAELADSEQRYRMLMEQASDGIGILGPGGRVASVNNRLCEMSGYAREEFSGLTLADIFMPDELPFVMADLELIRSGETVMHERMVMRKDGSSLQVEISARMLGDGSVLAITRDITKRKEAELALRKSEERLRHVVQHMPVMMCAFAEDGSIIAWNRECERVTGYSEEEVVGRPDAMSVLYPDDAYREAMLAEWKQKGNNYRDWEWDITCRDGSVRTVAWSNRSDVISIPGWSAWGIGIDVTERRRAELEKEAMQERLGEARKMEAIGSMAGGIAHDFNNLLTVIQGDNEMAKSLVGEGHDAYRCLALVGNAAARASELTRKLLIFSRGSHMAQVPTDLNRAVDDILKMLGHLIGEGIEVGTEFSPGLWGVNADASGIEQVVMNLALNARDAMPGGGRLTVGTANVEFGPEGVGTLEGSRPGRFVRLSVTDTGSGMDEETVRRIFEPFFTTKSRGRGTGLGLPVVYGIVKDMGGWINVESTPGKGSRFDVYLGSAGQEPAGSA